MQFRKKYLKNQIELLMTSYTDHEFWMRRFEIKKCTLHKILQFCQGKTWTVSLFSYLLYIIPKMRRINCNFLLELEAWQIHYPAATRLRLLHNNASSVLSYFFGVFIKIQKSLMKFNNLPRWWLYLRREKTRKFIAQLSLRYCIKEKDFH